MDLSEMTVMPGMINCHVHSLSPVGISDEEENALTTMEKAWWGMKNAHDYIDSGVTFVRSLGSEKYYDLEMKKCIEEGKVVGPHMFCAGRVITMTGGHGWKSGLESDGVDECRKHARELFTDEAVLFGYLEGKLEHGSIEQFYHNVDTVPGGDNFKARVDVLMVEETLAVVRVLEQGWGNRIDFTDVLLLLKMDGEWKCVAKAYNQNSNTIQK